MTDPLTAKQEAEMEGGSSDAGRKHDVVRLVTTHWAISVISATGGDMGPIPDPEPALMIRRGYTGSIAHTKAWRDYRRMKKAGIARRARFFAKPTAPPDPKEES